jgi:hypothetical protein
MPSGVQRQLHAVRRPHPHVSVLPRRDDRAAQALGATGLEPLGGLD